MMNEQPLETAYVSSGVSGGGQGSRFFGSVKAPEQMPQLGQQLDLLAERIDGLREMAGRLEDRLGPVLLPAPPMGEGRDSPVQPGSAYVNIARSLVSRSEDLARTLASLIQRIQV